MAGRLAGGSALTLEEAAVRLGRSFVGEFGWLDVRLPDRARLVAAGIATVLLLSLVALLARGRERQGGVAPFPILLVASGVALVAALSVLNATATGQAQGRYLFPLLAGISGLVGVAACAPFPPRAGGAIAWGLAAVLLAGNVAALLGVVRPAYSDPESGLLGAVSTPAGTLAIVHGSAAPSGFAPAPDGTWLLASPAGAVLDLGLELRRPHGQDPLAGGADPLPFTPCDAATGGIRLEGVRLVGRLAPGGSVTLRWHEPPHRGAPLAPPRLHLEA